MPQWSRTTAAVPLAHSSLTDKANEERATARNTVSKGQRDYELQKQSLQDFGKYASEDMDMAKIAKADARG